jgi:hypothetical protein
MLCTKAEGHTHCISSSIEIIDIDIKNHSFYQVYDLNGFLQPKL